MAALDLLLHHSQRPQLVTPETNSRRQQGRSDYLCELTPCPVIHCMCINPCITCRWLQQLCLLAMSCSPGVSTPPGGRPRTNTSCCPPRDCSWPVHSGTWVLMLCQNQHSAGPGEQPLQLEFLFKSMTRAALKFCLYFVVELCVFV